MQENNVHESGFVNSIIFESEISGYKVVEIGSEDGLELYTAVGTMPDVEMGEKLDMVGKWVSHSTYGEQFAVSEYRRSVPDDEESIERYLGSGVIKGVGEALAHRIVEAFGRDTFHVIEEEPERLSIVKGISDRKAVEIAEQFVEKAASREAMIYLSSLGLTPFMSMKVYQAFGSRTIQTVQTNPYLMAEKVSGISFH
nr:ATP-dependent RecD-like DNA helicase [Clostridia bacterium]